VALLPLVVLAAGALAGCGDDGDDDGVVDEAEQVLESAGALTVAESFRTALVAEDVGADVDRRNVTVLTETVDDLPGEPDVAGIADADGDGRDDDGKVEFLVDAEAACVTVAADGDVDVADGSC
jgi:hypothetical protein